MQHNWTGLLQLVAITVLLLSDIQQYAEALKVTAKIITNHNYPVEEHTVHTPDDYILTIYRIPDSPNLPKNESCTPTPKPVVLMQHGILCASDDWIINGPQTSLAYMFADAGYDVWLGNARGNTYSRQHRSISAETSDFWNFSWHEIGVYDLASMLDYVLDETGQSSVHFVAHSQGTTTYFVLMSTLPWYNEKVKTVHLLAPIAFMRNHTFILSKLGGLFLGYPSFLSWILGGMELLPITSVQKLFCEQICSTESMFKFLCSGLLDFIGGWGTRHLNHPDLVSQSGFTIEEHVVQTIDGYILTIFRIASSPKPTNGSQTLSGGGGERRRAGHRKPAVLLQHGFSCSSDTWLMSGRDTALAYLLADVGYDVWLGNARGNRYSPHHRFLATRPGSSYWKYSTHEIGVYDLPAMIDHIGQVSGQLRVHVVGYSAGTSAIVTLLAENPQYNERIHTIHLLGPTIFMRYRPLTSQHFLVFVWSKIEDFVKRFFINFPLMFHSRMLALIARRPCADGSGFQWVCQLFFRITGGWSTRHTNTTLLPHVCETHPAGASTTQIIHYLQLYNSGDFRQYDHGVELNKKYYQQETPPSYNITNIRSCVNLYYSDNDYMSAVEDVEYLATLLPCSELYRVPYKDWNHYDFLWSVNVKEVINDRIIDKMIRHDKENLL